MKEKAGSKGKVKMRLKRCKNFFIDLKRDKNIHRIPMSEDRRSREVIVKQRIFLRTVSGDIRLDESGFGFSECIRDARVYTCT